MKPIVYLFLFAFTLISYGANCCINVYKATLYGGDIYEDDGDYSTPNGRYENGRLKYLNSDFQKADSIYKTTGSLEDYSDLGAMYTFKGDYQIAKNIFSEIELKSPGLYTTAANIGTVYELIGNNDSAYYWIKKAIEINPASHDSSEWIHLKILEAKINSKGNSNYFHSHKILDVEFGDNEIPDYTGNIDLEKLHDQLQYQLRERISFVKPKNPVVAQLLFDLANITAIKRNVYNSLFVFYKAKEYGYSSPVMEKRILYLQKLQKEADKKTRSEKWIEDRPFYVGLFLTLILSVASLFSVFFVIRYKKRRKNIKY